MTSKYILNVILNNRSARTKKVAKIVFKTLLLILLIPLCLLLILVIILQSGKAQDLAGRKASEYLSAKTGGNISIRGLRIDLNHLKLEGLFIQDLAHDTLLYSEQLEVDFSFFRIFSKTIAVTNIEIAGLHGKIKRTQPDSGFNFSFIPEAFAGNEPPGAEKKLADTIPSDWNIELQNIELSNARFFYEDQFTGDFLSLRLGSFETEIKNLDLNKPALAIKSISLTNTSAEFIKERSLLEKTPEEISQEITLNLDLDEISLHRILFIYKDRVANNEMAVNIGHLAISCEKLDLPRQEIRLAKLGSDSSSFVYTRNKTSGMAMNDSLKVNVTSNPTAPWRVHLTELVLNENSFVYDDHNETPVKQGIDYHHLFVQHIGIEANNITADPDKVSLQLKEMKLRERSGFELKNMSAGIVYDQQKIRLSKQELVTSNSKISGHLEVSYSSLAALSASPETTGLDIQLNSQVGLKDLRFFAPQLFNDAVFRQDAEQVITLSARASGRINDLHIQNFGLSAQGMNLKVNGNLQNINHPKQLYAELPVIEMAGKKNDIFLLLSSSMIPPDIQLPDSFHFKASFKGYLKNFDSDLDLYTSSGNILAEVRMNPGAGNTEQPYSAHIKTTGLNAGYLLKQGGNFGKVTLTMDVSGSGYDTSNLDAQINLQVAEAQVNKYSYSNFTLNGRFLKRSFTGIAAMDDKNLAFDFEGALNFDPHRPEYHAQFDLKGADFKALNVTENDLKLSLNLNAGMVTAPGQNPEGNIKVSNIVLLKDKRRYAVDSFIVHSTNKAGKNNITVNSDFLSAGIEGQYILSELSGTMKRHFNSYFNLFSDTSNVVYAGQDYNFFVKLINPAILTAGLVPGLNRLRPFLITGAFNSNEKNPSYEIK